jgi:gluconolactonase
MKLTRIFALIGICGAASFWTHIGQAQIQPPAGKTTGPGVQAAQDSKETDVLKTCKGPPPAGRGGRGAAGRGPAPVTGPRDYTVTAIDGVIAAGQKWTEVLPVDGNNADGIIATKDGGIFMAQNDASDIVKLDRKGKMSVVYSGLNTSGSLALNSKGVLFVANRGLNESIDELAPQRKPFATKINGDPLDCIGGVLNDISADSKGGVYFTMGGLFYADPKGNVTRYGQNLGTNGIILTADEKHVYVTNGPTLAAFDVQPDGSLTNQREFAKLEGGGNGDGSTFDAAGRLYVSSNPGVQVFSPDGKYLGLIPTPRGIISLAFSGPARKTLYAVVREGATNKDWIISIPTLAQGPKGRAK